MPKRPTAAIASSASGGYSPFSSMSHGSMYFSMTGRIFSMYSSPIFLSSADWAGNGCSRSQRKLPLNTSAVKLTASQSAWRASSASCIATSLALVSIELLRWTVSRLGNKDRPEYLPRGAPGVLRFCAVHPDTGHAGQPTAQFDPADGARRLVQAGSDPCPPTAIGGSRRRKPRMLATRQPSSRSAKVSRRPRILAIASASDRPRPACGPISPCPTR